jgi:tRNA-Thr(GGU) m(6)t(6)A37 methyltransferase TsaA
MTTETIQLEAIGHVRHPVPDEDVARRRRDLVSEIVILERFAPALEGIEAWSHLFVLFWMHKVAAAGPAALRARPRGRAELPELGVLAARGRQRPNPVGLAVAELLERHGNILVVRRLDAFDGTPVIDLKPYDSYDVVNELRTPVWWQTLTR